MPPSDQTNSVWFMMEGKSHSGARIANMTEGEKTLLINTLEQWLERDID